MDQAAATKTRLQVPLVTVHSNSAAASDGSSWAIASTTNTSYGQWAINGSKQFILFRKNQAAFDAILDWQFEVMLSNSVSGSAYAALFKSDGTQIEASETVHTGSTPTLYSTTIANNNPDFTDQSEFELRWRSGSSIRSAFLHKANLYVRLQNLTKAEIHTRLSKFLNTSGSNSANADGRLLIDAGKFSNLQFFYEATGNDVTLGAIQQLIRDTGTSDAGTTGTNVTASGIDYPSTAKSRQRWGRSH